MFSTLNALEFHSQFNCQADCLSYLACMKWKDGYTCRKCGCHDYTKGYTPFARRCKQCRYDESATYPHGEVHLGK